MTQQTEIRQAQGDTQYVEAILDRLVEHYITDTELHGEDRRAITVGCFHRLWRYVIAEGYGR